MRGASMIGAMIRRARARGASRLAAATALALFWLGDRPAAAEPSCTPIVRVSGEMALAGPVIALLRERGVTVEGESRCGTLTAVLTASGERTRITIVDADGRTVERMAGDARATATAIESWARGDLSAPLLAARAVPPATARQAPDREPPPEPIVQGLTIQSRPIAIAASGGIGLSSGGALWRAAHAHGCVAVGPTCLGTLVRYAKDTEGQGDSNIKQTGRWSVDMLLVGDVPLRFGRISLTPGVGVGQTTLRAERRSGEHEQVTTIALNLLARVGAGVRVTGAWSLQADMAFGASPYGRKTLKEEGADAPSPDDPPDMAGVPRVTGWFGIGLLYGGL